MNKYLLSLVVCAIVLPACSFFGSKENKSDETVSQGVGGNVMEKTIFTFFGAPGSGKGTLAEKCVSELGFKVIFCNIFGAILIQVGCNAAMSGDSQGYDDEIGIFYKAKIWELVKSVINSDISCEEELNEICRQPSVFQKDILPAYFILSEHLMWINYTVPTHHSRLRKTESVFSPGLSKKVLRASEGLFLVIDLEKNQTIFSFEDYFLDFLTWCPDDRYIISVTNKLRCIDVWDTLSGDCLLTELALQQRIILDECIENITWDISENNFQVIFLGGRLQHFSRVTNFTHKFILLIIKEMGDIIRTMCCKKLEHANRGDTIFIDEIIDAARRFLNAFHFAISRFQILRAAWDDIGINFGRVAQSFLINELRFQLDYNRVFCTVATDSFQ